VVGERPSTCSPGGFMHLNLHTILTIIALVCGVMLLMGSRFNKYPLAAIAIICLAIKGLNISF
jgi:hypothetical protein